MILTELTNLFIVLAIFTGPALLVWLTRARLRPIFVALVFTPLAVIASGTIWSAGFGYGGYLMLTIPFSPLVLLYGWLVAMIVHRWTHRQRQQIPA